MPALKPSLPKVYIFLAVAIWGIATPVIKATIGNVPPFTFLMLRFWVAGIITIPLSIYIIKKNKINLQRAKHIIISSTLGHIIALSLIFLGLSKTSSLEGSVLTAFSPLLVAALGFIILRELLSKKKIEGALLAFFGTLIILSGPILHSQTILNSKESFIGNILIFLGILFDGLYVIYIKKHLSHDKIISPLILTILSFAFAFMVFTPIGVLEQYNQYKSTHYAGINGCKSADIDSGTYSLDSTCNYIGCYSNSNPTTYTCVIRENITTAKVQILEIVKRYLTGSNLIGIIYMAFFSGILAYLFFQKGLQKIGASEASIFYYLQPLFGIPISMIFLHENVSWAFVVGAMVIASGIYLAEMRKS